MSPLIAGDFVMYEVQCCLCHATCFMHGTVDYETNSFEVEPDGTEEWEGGCVVIDGLFIITYPCDHEVFEGTGEESHYDPI